MGLLPSRIEAAVTPDEPEVLDIEADAADTAFEALSAGTARRILAALYDRPRTPVEVREEVGTSLQNVHYHLDKLESAGLIEPAGTGYSAKGNEMTVYGPASEAIVLFAGQSGTRARLRRVLQRVGTLFLVLVAASVSLHYVLEWLTPDSGGEVVSTGVQPRVESDGAAGKAVETARELGGIDPALAFFLGGAVVLTVLGVWWYYRGY